MVKRFILVLVGVSLFCGSVWAQGGEILRFIYCSDLHYGLERDFRGEEDVPADSVSRAMIASFGFGQQGHDSLVRDSGENGIAAGRRSGAGTGVR